MNANKLHSTKNTTLAATPMADALLAMRENIPVQFQSLPLSGGASVRHSAHANKYEALFGKNYLASEALFAGAAFDTFFFPERVIKQSEVLAANAFGAKHALFVTTGTTVSNQIAINALIGAGTRVIVDRSCHQSVHFALHTVKAQVDYFETTNEYDITGRGWWSIDLLLTLMLQAQEAGNPYELLVLNGQSYDGVMYNISAIVETLHRHGVRLKNLLVDEAWGSAAYFHPEMQLRSAMHAARQWADELGMNIVATHSVHKSMSSLRQASMILCHGEEALVERMQYARFKIHTTSPNYPILVSIDLARAQMSDDGATIMQGCITLADQLRSSIESDPDFSLLTINTTHIPELARSYVGLDQTKVSINVSRLSATPPEIKQRLFQEFGIWVNRCTTSSILFNIHIGIDAAAIDRILAALRMMVREEIDKQAPTDSDYPLATHFVIAYPAGVPIVVPGERMTSTIVGRIQAARQAGSTVFTMAQ
jgi:arginine/lysine/ornithine decarboxylase